MASVVGNRRPLDLSMSDGETEDEDKPRQAPKSTDELIAEADELIVKKKARHTKPFTEDVLTHPDGLQRIYEEFPVACKFRGRGSEAKDIKKLMAMYREWAFQLHPALAFSDIISKCESLGSKGKTRYFIQNLRDRERNRYIKEVLDVANGSRYAHLDSKLRPAYTHIAPEDKVSTNADLPVATEENNMASSLPLPVIMLETAVESPSKSVSEVEVVTGEPFNITEVERSHKDEEEEGEF